LAGSTVLRETFTVGMAIGFVLVLAGSVLATRRRAGAASRAGVASRATKSSRQPQSPK